MVLLNIVDVQVDFPYNPYTVQLSMMNRIIATLNNKDNCLLESPTGTGKTMALLCSSLAWVQKLQAENKINFKDADDKQKPIVPKIFFGTRTHKQIGQVVREMSRSAYSSIPMTILSSRKQSCVNAQVLSQQNIDEACRDACKTKSCCFRKGQGSIPGNTWDLESMKVELKKKIVCPYYQTRDWLSSASIVFCPYNYLLTPSIRKSVNINLRNAIIILDEGHNIENICMEGASLEMAMADLNSYKFQCLGLLKCQEVADNSLKIIKLIDSMTAFIEALSSKLAFMNVDILKNTWDSKEVVVLMNAYKLDKESVATYKNAISGIEEIIKKLTDMNDETFPKINATMFNILDQALVILEYLLNEPPDLLSDFKVVVLENGTFTDMLQDTELSEVEPGEFLSSQKRKRKNQKEKPNYILQILCMNPAIVFKDIAAETHSIVLASGTLAPMSSFQRELACTFSTTLQGCHVVDKTSTMIASVSCGPRGIKLNSTYKNVDTLSFQDELGSLLLNCCMTVPHGVLFFVSSFQMIDKLFKRWQATKVVVEMQKHKTILLEPRNSGEMSQCMEDYYTYLDQGALMIAVYRGKVSEGMDFSDKAARLVIAVGIPYPSYLDFKVNLKKNHNDQRIREAQDKTQFLSGLEWYSIQAYRALNQAIGRCIRHKNDWGAMIFVDDRFSEEYYDKGLCKWIQMRKKHFGGWSEFHNELREFIKFHEERERGAAS